MPLIDKPLSYTEENLIPHKCNHVSEYFVPATLGLERRWENLLGKFIEDALAPLDRLSFLDFLD